MTHKSLVVVLALTSGAALAVSTPPINPGPSPTHPRVLIVFDTSSSMSQAPDFTISNQSYWDDTLADPSATPDSTCRSKFCIAKKTVYTQLQSHVQHDVQIGLATYYQYLIRYEPASSSRCWYDAMWQGGQTLYYPRDGTWLTEASRFSPVTGVDLSSANAAVTSGRSNQYNCSSASSSYDLTEQQSDGGTLRTCTVYDRPQAPAGNLYTTPGSGFLTASGCDTAKQYASVFNQLDKNGSSYYRWRVAPTVACPTAVPSQADYSAVSSTQMVTVTDVANNTTCGTTGYGCWQSGYTPFGSPVSNTCTASSPCLMYSAASGTETATNALVEWVGYFGGTCTGGSQPAGPNAGDSSTTTGRCALINSTGPLNSPAAGVPGFYDSGRVTGATIGTVSSTFTSQANCRGLDAGVETRLFGGETRSNYNSASQATIRTAFGGVTSGYTASYSPPSATTTCTSDWPCDVTLTNQTPSTNTVSDAVYNSCTPGSSGGNTTTCSPSASVQRQLLKTGASCPSFAADLTSNPAGYWNTPTPGSPGCGAGTSKCTMTASATPTTVAAMPCSSPATTWTSSTPTACTYHGVTGPAYTAQAGSPTSIAVYYEYSKSSSATCPANNSTATNTYQGGALTPVNSTYTADVSSCVSAGCKLTGLASSNSTTQFDTTTSTTNTNPGANWVAGSPAFTVSSTPTYTSLPCTSYVNGNNYTIPSTSIDGQFVAGGGYGGSTDTGIDPAHPENHIYKCAFKPVTYSWQRPYNRCAYTITKYVWESAPTITWCNYDLAKQRQVVTNTVYSCTYQMKVRKFDFQPPAYKICNFFRTSTALSRTAFTYRYLYATRGGELIGSYYTDVAGEDVCNTSVPYSDFSSSCPTRVDGCVGTGTTCLLRNSGTASPESLGYSTNPVNAKASSGRFSNFAATSGVVNMPAPSAATTVTSHFAGVTAPMGNHLGTDGTTGLACRAADYTADAGTADGGTEPPRAGYCVLAPNDAASTAPIYRLVSDYMDCTDPADPLTCHPNSINDIINDPRTGTTSLRPGSAGVPGTFHTLTSSSWTSADTKAYGMSGTGGNYNTPSLVMMPFVPDGTVNGDVTGFQTRLSTCAPPVDSTVGGNVVWPTWQTTGMCMPTLGAPAPSPYTNTMLDYTPLYGALQNAYQYIKHEVSVDPNYSCRKYFVILATDGQENTPANKSSTELQGAVSQLRTLTTDNSRSTNVKTYVLGFGDQVADPTAAAALNDMANAGDTSAAYFASDQTTLASQLTQVFSSILAGTYTRTKPVISSDGRNIYMSYYDVLSGGLEWPGHFAAFGINPSDGQVSLRWELSDKLDNKMSDSDRALYTDASGARLAFTAANGATSGAGTFGSLLNVDTATYPSGLSPSTIVDFVRNSAKVTGAGGTGEYFYNSTTIKRLSRLNAIVSSTPVVVGRSTNATDWGGVSPSTALTEYSNFQTASASRETRIIVGSSDGILRAVRDNADTVANPTCVTDDGSANCPNGKEAWGWVPSILHPKLYESMIAYFSGVDGQTAVEDVCGGTGGNARSCVQADWKTVSITAMRNGGRGLIALDVSEPSNPKFMWKFEKTPTEDGLGYAQAPVIGRVERAGNSDQFVAVVAGGARAGGVYAPLTSDDGNQVHVLSALDGGVVVSFTAHDGVLNKADLDGNPNQFYARPSYYRRAGTPQMDNAMLSGTAGVLYTMRFREPPTTSTTLGVTTINSPAVTTPASWSPKIFFDPTDATMTQSPTGAAVTIRRVVQSGTSPNYTYVQEDCSSSIADSWSCGKSTHPATMPLSGPLDLAEDRQLPFYLRPRLTALYDSNRLTADYFIGTGELPNPTIITTASDHKYLRNYFYAVHDVGSTSNGAGDGRLLWVNQFLDATEQMVSEPAIVNGSLIVATYFPPTESAGGACASPGDTRLYCFDPLKGDLRSCLVTGDGTTSSVVLIPNVGIPSDLVSANGALYLTTSNPPPNQPPEPIHQSVRPMTASGDKRSFRRVR